MIKFANDSRARAATRLLGNAIDGHHFRQTVANRLLPLGLVLDGELVVLDTKHLLIRFVGFVEVTQEWLPWLVRVRRVDLMV